MPNAKPLQYRSVRCDRLHSARPVSGVRNRYDRQRMSGTTRSPEFSDPDSAHASNGYPGTSGHEHLPEPAVPASFLRCARRRQCQRSARPSSGTRARQARQSQLYLRLPPRVRPTSFKMNRKTGIGGSSHGHARRFTTFKAVNQHRQPRVPGGPGSLPARQIHRNSGTSQTSTLSAHRHP